MNHGDGKVSPAKFHSSVHNTPGGYASIAAGNVAQSTTLTGGSELVSAALIETMCLVESIKSDVIVVFADEALKPPFDVPGSGPPPGPLCPDLISNRGIRIGGALANHTYGKFRCN